MTVNSASFPESLSPLCACARELLLHGSDEPMLLDESITALEPDFLTEHLSRCESCRVYSQTMNVLTHSLAELEDMPFPANLEDRIMESIALQESSSSTRARSGIEILFSKRQIAGIAAAVAVLVMAAVGFQGVFLPRGEQPEAQIAQLSSQTVFPVQSQKTDRQPASALSGAVSVQQQYAHRQTALPVQKKVVIAQPSRAQSDPSGSDKKQKSDLPIQPESRQVKNAEVVDHEVLASVSLSNVSNPFQNSYNTVVNAEENELYQDPLSDMVGF